MKMEIMLTQTDYPNLEDVYSKDWDSFEKIIKKEIPEIWTCEGDDCSGARVVILFETENIPQQSDFINLVNAFTRAETKLVIKGILEALYNGTERVGDKATHRTETTNDQEAF